MLIGDRYTYIRVISKMVAYVVRTLNVIDNVMKAKTIQLITRVQKQFGTLNFLSTYKRTPNVNI